MPTALGTVASHRTAAAGGGGALPVTSGLLAWFDPTDNASFTYSTGGDPGVPPETYVSKWNDKSGNANHALGSGNSGYHPKRNVTINGLKAVDYSLGYVGVTKGLVISTLPTSQKPVSYFFVMRTPATLVSGGQFHGMGISLRHTGTNLEVLVYATTSFGSAGPIATSTNYLVGLTYSATGQYDIRLNGVSKSTGTNNVAAPAGAGGGLGSANDTGGSFAGYMAEYAVYNRVLTAQEITDTESYLINKWMGPWTPAFLPGLAGWYDASDAASITASAGAVSQWNDKSGNTKHMVQATGAKQPKTGTVTINGRNSIDFDGTDDVLVGPLITTANTNFAMFVVVQMDAAPVASSIPFNNGLRGNNGYGIAIRANGTTIGYLRGGTAWQPGTTPAPSSGTHLLSLICTAGSTSLRYDTVEDIAAGPAPGGGTAEATFGQGDVAAIYFNGQIGEALLYNVTLSTVDRQSVENYLKSKWGTP